MILREYFAPCCPGAAGLGQRNVKVCPLGCAIVLFSFSEKKKQILYLRKLTTTKIHFNTLYCLLCI